MNRTEQSLQTALVTWLKLQHPKVLFKVDHGASQHKVSMIERQIYKKQSFAPGYPDFQLIKPTSIYAGLFIELKGGYSDLFNKNGTAKRGSDDHIVEQYNFLLLLREEGYCAQFVWDLQQGIDLITAYLKGETITPQIIRFNSETKFEKADREADAFFAKHGQ